MLGHEESLRLIRAAQCGDEAAKETLIVRNTALVKSIVKKFLNRGVEFDDLMQIGSLGLVKAVLGYDRELRRALFDLRRAHDRGGDQALSCATTASSR